MRKIVVILIALLSTAWTLSVTQAQQQGEKWAISAIYTAPDSSVSIQYPGQWVAETVTGVPGIVAKFRTPSGSINRMYGELSVGQYQGLYASLSDIKNVFMVEPESSGATLAPTQIAGHPALRADHPLPDGTTSTLGLFIDFNGTLVVLNVQGSPDVPDNLDGDDVAMLLAMAASIQIPAGNTAPPTEIATAPADPSATTTFTVEDTLYALTSPSSWPWTSDYVRNGTASMYDMAGGLSGSISTRVNSNAMSMVDYLTTYWQKPLDAPDLLTVTKLNLPGLDAAQGIYRHPGSGQVYLVSMRNQVIVILMNGDEAVLNSQRAAILAMVASIVPGRQAGRSAAAYAAALAAAPSAPEQTAEPVIAATATSAPACTLIAKGTVNVRNGPGTNFAQSSTLFAGMTLTGIGQTTGADGKLWYQTAGPNYVRSDLVRTQGDCTSVPTVTP